ncbi:MAG: MBL fold metallo-hydrolase [Propionibacteriaceae bacterium]|nr:MBL fold metallo-hydrolase [Propionibacteriaceae bacterium]
MAVLEEEATVSLIVGETGCLLVDTGSTSGVGNQIREAISRITDQPLTTVVLTHGHWDHSFGLSAFSDYETLGHEDLVQHTTDDIPVIVGDLYCRENLNWATDQGINPKKVTLPTTLISLITVRDLGNLSVEIAHFGQAHSRTDLIIAIPTHRVVIVGDLVESGPPQFDETSSIHGWVTTLDSLYGLLKPDTCVIPGHGEPLGPEHVAHFRAGLAAIWDQAEWAFKQSIPLAEVYTHKDLNWPWDRTTAEKGISLAYAELAARTM